MRYRYYQARGHRSSGHFRDRFQALLNHDLRLLFPRMYIGKEADLVKGGFSVFLAVDSPDGLVPLEVQERFLRPLNLKGGEEVDYENVVKGWGINADRALDLSRLARVAEVRALAPDDPFASYDEDPADKPSSMEREHLFLWMSATGRGTYDAFRRTCIQLDVAPDATAARRLLRNLRLLGHVEVGDDGLTWSVAPPTLVQRDADASFFLAGARDVDTMEALDAAAMALRGLERKRQESPTAPKAVVVSGLSEERILEVLRARHARAAWAGRAAHRLLETLAGIDQGHLLFTRVEHADLYLSDLRLYDTARLQFAPVTHAKRPGLYELKSQRKPNLPPICLLHDGEGWYRGDFYGLRFLARCQAGERCPMAIDASRGLVAIPEDWHLPELYERALVLASGLLPKPVGLGLVYAGVSRETAELLAERLHARVEEHGRA